MHQKTCISRQRKNTTGRSKMHAWNSKLLFICIFIQLSSAERLEDGKALFFGLPVQPRVYDENSASPVQALLRSTFLKPESNEGNDSNIPYEIIEQKMVVKSSESATDSPLDTTVNSTEKDFQARSPESVTIEFPKDDSIGLVPNLLQTEETASNTQRQQLNGVTLASFIRSAVALTRPLTSQRPTTIQNFFSKTNRDPLRDVASLAEAVLGRIGNAATKQNPIDFLNVIDNMQSTIDRMGGEGECTPIIELMDQTIISLKELIEMMNAVQKLGDMWSTANIPIFRKCIAKPGGISAGATQNSEKIENVPNHSAEAPQL